MARPLGAGPDSLERGLLLLPLGSPNRLGTDPKRKLGCHSCIIRALSGWRRAVVVAAGAARLGGASSPSVCRLPPARGAAGLGWSFTAAAWIWPIPAATAIRRRCTRFDVSRSLRGGASGISLLPSHACTHHASLARRRNDGPACRRSCRRGSHGLAIFFGARGSRQQGGRAAGSPPGVTSRALRRHTTPPDGAAPRVLGRVAVSAGVCHLIAAAHGSTLRNYEPATHFGAPHAKRAACAGPCSTVQRPAGPILNGCPLAPARILRNLVIPTLQRASGGGPVAPC